MDKDIIQILWSALLIVIVTIVPLVIAFLCLQKYWQSGLAAGAVKE